MMTPSNSSLRRLLIAIAILTAIGTHANAATGTWAITAAGTSNWNANASWSPNTGFPGTAAGDTANLTNAPTGQQTINLNQNITVGTLNTGASTANSFTINVGTAGGQLTLNNSGAGASINQNSVSNGDNIVAPIVIADTLSNTITNASATKALKISGGITGSQNLTLDANAAGVLTIQTAAVNNVGSITNAGTGAGTTTISGGVGANVTGITENSATSALTVSGTALSVNASGTTLTNANASGSSVLTVSGGVAGSGNLVLKNNSSITSGITLSGTAVNNAGTITNSGSGSGNVLISAAFGTNVTGVTQSSTTSGLTLSGGNSANAILYNINNGTVTLSANNAIGALSTVNFANTAGVTLALGGTGGVNLGALTGGGTTGGTITHTGTVNIGGVSANNTYAGSVSGQGDVTFNVATGYTQTLTGAWTYTGNSAFTVASGTVEIGSTAVIGSGGTQNAYNLQTSGTGNLTIDSGTTVSKLVTSMNQASSGTYTINGTISSSQGGTISNGTLSIGATGNMSSGQSFTVNGTGVVTEASGGNFSSAGGGAGININAGTVTFNSSANTYTGTTNVNNGTLNLGANAPVSLAGALGNNANAVGLGSTTLTGAASILTNIGGITIGHAIAEQTGSVTNSSLSIGGTQTTGVGTSPSIYTGNISLTAPTTLTSASGGEVDFTTGVISGTANLIVGGGGLVKLTGPNTFGSSSNSVTVSGGTTLTTTNAGANLGVAGNTLIFNNGIYKFGSALDLSARTIQFSSGGGAFDTNGLAVSFANAIGNSGTGGGGLTLADSNGTPGSLTLSGQNTYTGGTTITTGTLVAGVSTSGSTGALGSTSGALAVNGGGLDLHSTSQAVGNLTGTGGSIYNNGSGTSTLTIGTGNGTGGNYAGVIKNNTGSGGTVAVTKTGSGTITLSGANTYTGATTVSGINGTLALAGGSLGGTAVSVTGGTLQIGAASSTAATTIGTAGASSLTINGGTLSLANGVLNTLNINNASAGATAFTLGASGAAITLDIGGGSAGAQDTDLINLSNSAVASLLSGSTTINLNIIGTGLNGTQQQLVAWSGVTGSSTFGVNVASGSAGIYTLSLTATSTGLYLNEASTSSAYWKGGTSSSWATIGNFTTDSAGTSPRSAALDTSTSVVFNASGAANFSSTLLNGSYTINNLTFNTGGVGIGVGSGGTLTLSSAGSGITVTTGAGTTPDTISTNLVMGASQTWSVADSGSTLVVSGNVSGSGFGLTKGGSGTLQLSGTNSYSGATTITGGTLNIQGANALNGTSGISVASGSSLQLQSSGGITVSAKNLSLNGTGTGTAGSLENVSGNNTYPGTITLVSPSSIGSDAGTLTVSASTISNSGSNTLTLTGAGNGDLISALSNGALTMSGSGMWDIDGANSYTGTTTVSSGTLQLGNSGNGTLGSGSNPLTINGGAVDLNGNNLNVGNLTGTGGSIINNNPSGNFLTISGSGTYAGTIANVSSGSGALIKQGSGVETFTGANTSTDPTYIQGGALNSASAGALGSSSSYTAAVYVSSGAALQLSGGFVTSAQVPLSLVGTGVTGAANGALENVSGSNTYTGLITLTGPTSIGADTSSTLNLSNTATIGGGYNLTLVGAGNGSIASVIGPGSGTLTMNGTGTWTLSGNNTYTGATTVNNTGTLILSGSNSYTGATTVSNGTLDYSSGAALGSTSGITLGNTSTATPILNYAGSGETIAKTITFTGNQQVTLGNIGTGAVVYSAAPTFANGGISIVLGNASDTAGGSIGTISSSALNLSKNGQTNSTWILTGTSNAWTGQTFLNGGVLQFSSQSALPSATAITLQGNSGGANNGNAIIQTSGTFTETGTPAFNWYGNAGFSAIGGTLTLAINSGNTLIWGNGGGVGSISTGGGAPAAFGSNTSNAQVILPNNINLNTGDTFQQNVYVAKGAGGDSTLFQGALLNGSGTGAASGFNKAGGGTLILSNGNSTYAGYTTIVGGTLVAEASSLVTVANSSSTSTGVFGSGFGSLGAGTGAAGTGSPAFVVINLGTNGDSGQSTEGGVLNPTLDIGGSYTIANPVNILWSTGTNQTFGLGGYLGSGSNATFSGPITLSGTAATGNSFAVTQVTGGILNLNGGITSTAGTAPINFANAGAVNVDTAAGANALTNAITNGSGTVSVTQSGAGTTTLGGTNTYTGGTTISGGVLALTGSTSATGTVTVGGVSGGLSTAVLTGTGTVGGALTTSSANSNVAHLAPGVNTSGNFGSAGTLTIGGALTVGVGSNLDLDLSANNLSGNDSLLMTGTGTSGVLTIGGLVTVNINALGTLATGSANYYTLINGAASSSGLTAGNFTATLSGAGTTGDSAVFLVAGNNLEVYFIGVPTAAYFNGLGNDLNTLGNYDSAATGNAIVGGTPAGTTNVFFSATRNTSTTPNLSAPLTVNSVTFGAGSGTNSGLTVSATGTGSLTLNATNVNGNTAGNGITLATGGGSDTISAPVVLGGTQTWTVTDSSSTLAVSGAVSGGYNLSKAGAGTLTLSGANTFSGGLNVLAGTVGIGVSNTMTVSGAAGPSTSAVALGNTSGSVNASLLTEGAYTFANAINVVNGSTGNTLTIGGATNNSSAFSGLVTLNNALTVSQVTTTGSNALNLTGGINGGTSGTETVTFAGPGAINVSSNGIADNGSNKVNVVVSGGTVTLSATNTYTGTTQVQSGGTLVYGSANALSSSTAITLNGSTFNDNFGTATLSNSFTVTTGTTGTISNSTAGLLTLSGPISKNGSTLNVTGGKFVISGGITGSSASSDVNYVGGSTTGITTVAGTYNGPTSISGGSTVLSGVNDALADTTGGASNNTALTLGTSGDGTVTNTFDLLGHNQTVSSLSGLGTGTTNQIISGNGVASTATTSTGASSSTGNLTVSYTNTGSSDTFSGSLGGAGSSTNFSLTKSGAGKVVLTGANTYTGGTTINGGTLTANNTSGSATGTGAVTVNSTGTLTGKGSIDDVIVSSGGTVSPGSTAQTLGPLLSSVTTTNNILMATSLTVNGGATLSFNLYSTTANTGTHANPAGSTLISDSGVFNYLGSGAVTLQFNGTGSGGNVGRANVYDLVQFVTSGSNVLTSDFAITGLDAANVNGGSLSILVGNGTNGLASGVSALELDVVPEPSTWAMMLGGLALLVVLQRRKKNSY